MLFHGLQQLSPCELCFLARIHFDQEKGVGKAQMEDTTRLPGMPGMACTGRCGARWSVICDSNCDLEDRMIVRAGIPVEAVGGPFYQTSQ